MRAGAGTVARRAGAKETTRHKLNQYFLEHHFFGPEAKQTGDPGPPGVVNQPQKEFFHNGGNCLTVWYNSSSGEFTPLQQKGIQHNGNT